MFTWHMTVVWEQYDKTSTVVPTFNDSTERKAGNILFNEKHIFSYGYIALSGVGKSHFLPVWDGFTTSGSEIHF